MSIDHEMKILLVEDSALTRKMEAKILNEVGFKNIVEAEDGEAAIQKLQEQKDVSLIISDWNMPNKNGYEFLVWVRSDETCRNIPFIMATAQAEKKQTSKATEAGVSNFITKPFSAQELRSVIEETFGPNKGSGEDIEEPRLPRKTASGKVQLSVAHIQITDHLTLGVLKHLIESENLNPEHFELETRCVSSWNPLQKALEKGDIDAALILAPIAMDLFSVDVPIKLVLLAHKNGSICVSNKKGSNNGSLQQFFKGKSFYIPHMLSIHHMLSTMFLRQLGLKPGVAGQEGVDAFFEVVPPVKMPEFLAETPDAGGYTVAEPLGTKAIAAGTGDLMFLSAELWEYHPCCVVAVRDELINAHPEAVQEFTTMLVQSGQFIAQQPDIAAEIAVDFLDPQKKLGLKVPVLKNVLKEPQGIKTDDLFPVIEDLDRIQRYMVEEMGIGTLINLEEFMDTRFAEVACHAAKSVRRPSKVHDISKIVSKIVNRKASQHGTKTMLDREGKYLSFTLANEEYGMGILKIKEIIGMMPITPVPRTREFVRGVLNLRGKVIPVVDLRLRFGIEAADYTERTCIIIVEIPDESGIVQIGVVVDSVSEVLYIKADEIEDTPTFGTKVSTEYILGMAKMEGGVKLLLDIDQVLGSEEMALLEKAA